MAWMTIIQFILTILSFISGLFFPTPSPTPSPNPTQYTCAAPKWSQAPTVVNGQLVGTIQQTCSFEGRSGGGLSQLQQHLVAQTKAYASGPVQTSQGGAVFATSFSSGSEEAPIRSNGTVTVALSGTKLQSSFEQTAVYTSSEAQYVTGLNSSMVVTPTTKAHWYNATATQAVKIQKPPYVSVSYFQNQIVSGLQNNMTDSMVDAINDMANHL